MASASLLEQYVSQFQHSSSSNILDSFQNSLIDLSENTRRAYTTDVYKFLIDKFFNFWDFHCDYNPIAQQVAIFHVLDRADESYKQCRLSASKKEQVLERALSISEKNMQRKIPSKTKSNPLQLVSQSFLGNISYSQRNNRLTMSLRNDIPSKKYAFVRKQDEVALDFLFYYYNELIDPPFLEDIFREDKIGEVLQFHERNGNKKNTIARKMSSLYRFERFLYKHDLISRRVLDEMPRPKIRTSKQIYLSGPELTQLYRYLDRKCESSDRQTRLLAYRNRAMISILDTTLVRGSALCDATIDDLNMNKRELFVREKGREENIVPIVGKCYDYINSYLRVRPLFLETYSVEEEEKDYLFHTKRGLRMTRRSLSRIINESCSDCDIKEKIRLGNKKHIGTHAIRRSNAILLKRNRMPIEDLARLMNHRNIETTRRYTEHADTDLRKSLKQYHPRAKSV